MAQRVELKAGLSPEIAVKCDLCVGERAGPACVASCPTQAIARIDPSEAMADVRAVLGATEPPRVVPRPSPAWPWLAGAAVLAVGVSKLHGGYASGVAAGVATLGLVAYSALRRKARRFAVDQAPRSAPGAAIREGAVHRSRVRPHYVAHMALGIVACGLVVAHAGVRVAPNLAGALALVYSLALVTGIAGGVLYAFVPRLLSRVERSGALPEDLRARAEDLEARLFRELTGRSELVKTIFARVLRPYDASRLGAVALVASRRTLTQERAVLRARVDVILGGRGEDKLQGLDDLVRFVVERRALRAQRALQNALRVWLPIHVVLAAVAVVLLAAHVLTITRVR
jgi:hypothetical protein